MIAYLDIETSFEGEVTVVGLLEPERGLVQIVGPSVTKEALEQELAGVDTVCTFGGEYFDLVVLRREFGLDLLEQARSLDLSILCRKAGLRGGLKHIEHRLQIPRGLNGVNGYDAMVLWDKWIEGDVGALQKLLSYNADDVLNLALLERRLRGDLEMPSPPPRRLVGLESQVM